jgi:hypothetical protein
MPTPRPDLPESAQQVDLAGTYGRMAHADFEKPTLLLEYILELTTAREVMLMFNSPQPHRVWLGDDLVIGREIGRMSPSFHRAPLHQWHFAHLPVGKTRVTVAITRPASGDAEWVIGAGDRETRQWLPHAFRGRPC